MVFDPQKDAICGHIAAHYKDKPYMCVPLVVQSDLLGLMWIAFAYFGISITGLFSPEYSQVPWSLGKVVDLLQHIWLPALVLGIAGTARLTRIMRANLLDELNKPYVVTARAKGLREWRLVLRYPVRLALNPLISTIGWYLPQLFSGSLIVATVMNLPNIGPLLLRALINQDMYLAGAILLIYSFLTIVGTLLSDIALAMMDRAKNVLRLPLVPMNSTNDSVVRAALKTAGALS
jgi:peptide/nickel transport system permease protein